MKVSVRKGAFLDIFEELLVLKNFFSGGNFSFFLEYRCDFFYTSNTPLQHTTTHCNTHV